MQVITRGSARYTHRRDLLPLLHYVADRYAHGIAVGIPCLYAVTVRYLNYISVRSPITRKSDDAVIHSIDRRSFWISQINTRMSAPSPGTETGRDLQMSHGAGERTGTNKGRKGFGPP